MHRVRNLADREAGFKPADAKAYYSIIPLPEIIAEALKTGVNSKKAVNGYMNLLVKLGSEFSILMDLPLEEIERAGPPVIMEAIARMRSGEVSIAPGFDGEFGKVKIFAPIKKERQRGSRIDYCSDQ